MLLFKLDDEEEKRRDAVRLKISLEKVYKDQKDLRVLISSQTRWPNETQIWELFPD